MSRKVMIATAVVVVLAVGAGTWWFIRLSYNRVVVRNTGTTEVRDVRLVFDWKFKRTAT